VNVTLRLTRPVIALTTGLGILLAVVAVYALLSAGAAHADSTFHPTTVIKYCNDMENPFPPDTTLNGGAGACNDTAGLVASGHPDLTSNLVIPGPSAVGVKDGNLNFSNIVTLAPNSETITPGGNMLAGETVGALHSATTLGTFNGACNTSIGVDFLMFNVALPNNPTNPRASTNISFPQPFGTDDRFGRWGAPGAGAIAVGGGDPITTTGFSYIAAGSNNAIQGYPSYLLDAFDADFNPLTGADADNATVHPLVPLAVYAGLTQVAGSWIPLDLVQFGTGGPAGTATDLTSLTANPLNKITAAMGQAQVAVLNDPTAPNGLSNISDFCSPLSTTTMLLGVSKEHSVARVTNPSSATQQFFLQYFASQRDTDQDGFENQIDTCPLNPNVGDPRWTPGPGAGVNGPDTNANGMDYACVPTVAPTPTPVFTAFPSPNPNDTDLDGYINRLDNCPLVPNGVGDPNFQRDSEIANTAPPADNGPITDGIGDVCDTGTITIQQNGQPVTITMSTTVANGRYMTSTNLVAKCIAGTDADGDGYCAGPNDAFDSGPHAAARHTSWSASSGGAPPALQMVSITGAKVTDARDTYMSQCNTAVVGQVVTPCAPFASPFTLGVDPVHACAQTTTLNDEQPWDNWAYDFNDSGSVNGQDLALFAKAYGKTVDLGPVNVVGMGNVGIYRFDLNNDGIVNGQDLTLLGPVYGKTCAQAGIPPFTQQ
jgi:Thrombospondin type 3 repeat